MTKKPGQSDPSTHPGCGTTCTCCDLQSIKKLRLHSSSEVLRDNIRSPVIIIRY